MKRLVVAVAVALMGFGIWILATGNDPESETQASASDELAAPSSTTSVTGTPSTTLPAGVPPSIDGLDTETIPTIAGEATGAPVPEWMPPGGIAPVPVPAGDCVPVEAGFGIEFRLWGDIQLPYASGWPTNEPGQPPNCAPDTPFGAAVTAAHALFIETLTPSLIPSISLESPAQQARIDGHPGPSDPAALGYVCEPVGWTQTERVEFQIFTRCEDGPIKITAMRMRRSGDRWLTVYPRTGEHRTWDAAGGESYYPFHTGH